MFETNRYLREQTLSTSLHSFFYLRTLGFDLGANQAVDRMRGARPGENAYMRSPGAPGRCVYAFSTLSNVDRFNKVFEDNKLPDAVRDTGYNDWLRTGDENANGTKMKGKFTLNAFNQQFNDQKVEQSKAPKDYTCSSSHEQTIHKVIYSFSSCGFSVMKQSFPSSFV